MKELISSTTGGESIGPAGTLLLKPRCDCACDDVLTADGDVSSYGCTAGIIRLGPVID